MVPSPPCGGRDLERNAPLEDGSVVPILRSDMEIEKGKGIEIYPKLYKYGVGTSGVKKEETKKLETRRIGQCVLKSKMIPRL